VDKDYAPEDIIDMCGNIMQVRYDHRLESPISAVPARVLEILTQFGVDLLCKNCVVCGRDALPHR
jgi:5,10-methylene-tetrahydrofolate dehydrogenase/methenyl tetrahydrofolate cyclohydrolase